MRQHLTIVVLLLSPFLANVQGNSIEDWDLWPLITPVLGNLSQECRSASEEYIRLLNESFHTNANLTEKHLNALRRFDSSGPIPFLQDGLSGDGIVEVNICDIIGIPAIIELCKTHFNNNGLILIPVGTFTGPGMESMCKKIEKSKYCTNFLLPPVGPFSWQSAEMKPLSLFDIDNGGQNFFEYRSEKIQSINLDTKR